MDIVISESLRFLLSVASSLSGGIILGSFPKPSMEKQIHKAFKAALKDHCKNDIIREKLKYKLRHYNKRLVPTLKGEEIDLTKDEYVFLEKFKERIQQTDAWEQIKETYFKEIKGNLCLLDNKIDELIKIFSFSDKITKYCDSIKIYADYKLNFNYSFDLSTYQSGHKTSLQKVLTNFINHNEKDLLLLKGGIGGGKSTSLYRLAKHLIHERQTNAEGLIPLIIELKDFRFESTESLLEYILKRINIDGSLSINRSDLIQILTNNHAILILDGFDEIKSITSFEKVLKAFIEILSQFQDAKKIIISLRSSILSNEELFLQKLERHLHKFNYDIVGINKLESIDIELAVVNQKTNANINFNNTDIINSPVLFNIYLQYIKLNRPEIYFDSKESLIENSLLSFLDYKYSERVTDLSSEEWWIFLEKCALDMVIKESEHLQLIEVEEILKELGLFSKIDFDKLFIDAIVRTAFELSLYGLTFTHQLFKEFLAGSKFAKILLSPLKTHDKYDDLIVTEATALSIQYFCDKLYPKDSNIKSLITKDVNSKYINWKFIPFGLTLKRDFIYYKLFYIPDCFWMSETLVTKEQYKQASLDKFEKSNYLDLHLIFDEDDAITPINNITYMAARTIANELFDGDLPTEDEWQRACCWVDNSYPRLVNLLRVGRVNKDLFTAKVRTARPNEFGIYDATGCLWQWTTSFDEIKINKRICKGIYWGVSKNQKLNGEARLLPTESYHSRTGIRIIKRTK